MNCYFCEANPRPGGMRLSTITADGVCHACGAAVCRQHGKRLVDRTAVLLCLECSSSMVTPVDSSLGLSRSAI